VKWEAGFSGKLPTRRSLLSPACRLNFKSVGPTKSASTPRTAAMASALSTLLPLSICKKKECGKDRYRRKEAFRLGSPPVGLIARGRVLKKSGRMRSSRHILRREKVYLRILHPIAPRGPARFRRPASRRAEAGPSSRLSPVVRW
jgi:hypothetical protein